MSAPIHSLLADELDISDEKAEKLLWAMLREVRKRARQEEQGVRLPELGKFTGEAGELTFHPSDSLKRAVNQRFEGLQSEDLSTAPKSEESDEQQSEGPSTITLGYQEEGWSPIDAPEPEDATDTATSEGPPTADEAETTEEDGADTEEFQPPPPESEETTDPALEDTTDPPTAPSSKKADKASSDSPPTEEISSPSPTASDSTEPEAPASEKVPEEPPEAASSPTDPESADTEELYPLADEKSDEPDESDSEESRSKDRASSRSSDASEEPSREEDEVPSPDDEYDALSEVWNSDSGDEEADDGTSSVFEEASRTLNTGAASEEEDTAPVDESDEELDTDVGDLDRPAETDVAGDETSLDDESADDPATSSASDPTRSPQKASSTFLRTLVTILVLFLLGGGAWYILGQRGLVPSPGQTIAQFSGPNAPSDSPSEASAEEGEAPSSATDGTSAQETPSSSEADTNASGASSPPPEQGIDPSAGGWTVVVASRSEQSAAAELAETFRQRFSDREVPVDLIQGTVDGTTRYRVAIGQFASQIEATAFLDANSDSLPNGTWTLELD